MSVEPLMNTEDKIREVLTGALNEPVVVEAVCEAHRKALATAYRKGFKDGQADMQGRAAEACEEEQNCHCDARVDGLPIVPPLEPPIEPGGTEG